MRIQIDLSLSALDHESFDSLAFEIRRVLSLAASKAVRQLDRPPSLCTAPEADDVLLSPFGSPIGTVLVTPE